MVCSKEEMMEPDDSVKGLANRTIYSLRKAGFTEKQILRLLMIRRCYQQGYYCELTDETKRLLFARYLYAIGKLRS